MGKNNMKKSKVMKKRSRRRGLFIFEVIVLLLLVAGLFVYAKLNGALDKINQDNLNMNNVGVNEGIVDNDALKGYQAIALVGLDNREGSLKYGNSDTMIIASINNDSKEVKLVSVYRDTYMNIGNDKYTKANAAYANGSAEQLLTMFNKNLDLNISAYVTVDFNAVASTVDLLGGLEIEMTTEEIVHLNNYCVETAKVTGKSYEKLPEEDGTYHLNGVQAVSYARIRYTAGNDFKRAARQRLIIYKMVEKAKKADLATLNKILDTVCPMVSSSLSKAEILKMGMAMITYDLSEQTGFPFDHLEGANVTQVVGSDCVVPVTLETNVVKLHEFLYPEEAYVPSETVKEYSDHIIEKSGYGEDSIPEESEDGALPLETFQ